MEEDGSGNSSQQGLYNISTFYIQMEVNVINCQQFLIASIGLKLSKWDSDMIEEKMPNDKENEKLL